MLHFLIFQLYKSNNTFLCRYFNLMKNLLVVLIVLTTISSLTINSKNLGDQEKYSHIEVVGLDTFGPQDDLANIFASIKNSIPPLENITYKTSWLSYSIYNLTVNLTYDASHQQTYVNSNNTLIIAGGQLDTSIYFDWCKDTIPSSSEKICWWGRVWASSDSVEFWKQVRI